MMDVPVDDRLAPGRAALAGGRWGEARAAFESCLAEGDSADASRGLASALWWLGENEASVASCTRAYAGFRRTGEVENAVLCAVWLAITYKANFANDAAANGWIGRADRLLAPLDPGPLHGWAWLARGYRMLDLAAAGELTMQAVDVARTSGDIDLEIAGLSQIGLIKVGQGEVSAGFALIDEAMAAALAGECSNLDTVVYTSCDMLSACELASDLPRAAQWCQVADEFVERYGCPFLYAECRIYYGSVLTATGRWADAEREIEAGLRITAGSCPGLHSRAITRLADLRIRQGRLDAADQLLGQVDATGESRLESTLARATLLLARGAATHARRLLERCLPMVAERRWQLVAVLDLMVDAHLAAGEVEAAADAAERLAAVGAAVEGVRVAACVMGARGRVAVRRGDGPAGVGHLESAVGMWSAAGLPFEAARSRVELGIACADIDSDSAVDHLRRALATLDDLGAVQEAARAASILRGLGVEGRSGAKLGETLTNREQEVLGLLAAGLSNPEIAAHLYISRKTAAHHVSHVLAKLDLRNRAEAAAFAVAASQGSERPPSPPRR